MNKDKKEIFKLALMLHDIGKMKTQSNENGKIRYIGHDKIGADIAEKRLKDLNFSNEDIKYAKNLILYHMKIHDLLYKNNKTKIKDAAKLFITLQEDLPFIKDIIEFSSYDDKPENGSKYKDLELLFENFSKKPKIITGKDVMEFPENIRNKLILQMRYLQLVHNYNETELRKYLKSEAHNILKHKVD
ncbi:MAG: HD domain-containing protein [Saccharolobus sp.]